MKKHAVLLFLAFLFIQNLYPQSWTRKTNFPDNKRYKAVAFSINNFGYAGLGGSTTRLERDFWKYDPSTDTWSQIDSFPAPGRFGAASFVINGRAYVVGGETYEGETRKDLWEYDPDSNAWTKKSDIPIDLVAEDNMIGFSIDNYGYVRASYNRPADFFQYDPVTDSWAAKANFPGSYRIINEVCFSVDGKGYIGSGFKETESTNDFWEYDPKYDTWAEIATFPGASRDLAVAFSTEKYGYVGLGIAGGIISYDFWRYNPENNSWTQIDSCGYSAMGAFAFSITNNGYVGTGIYTSEGEFWQYKPVIDQITNFAQSQVIVVYPNPAKNNITVSTSSNVNIRKVELIDIAGRIIKKWKDLEPGKNILKIESVLPGIYLLKMETEFGVKTEKIIIQ